MFTKEDDLFTWEKDAQFDAVHEALLELVDRHGPGRPGHQLCKLIMDTSVLNNAIQYHINVILNPFNGIQNCFNAIYTKSFRHISMYYVEWYYMLHID